MSTAPRVLLARAAVFALTVLAMSMPGTPLEACPSCAAGRQARAEVWNDDFALHLLFAVLPFIVIGAISVRVDAIGRAPSARKTRGRRT